MSCYFHPTARRLPELPQLMVSWWPIQEGGQFLGTSHVALKLPLHSEEIFGTGKWGNTHQCFIMIPSETKYSANKELVTVAAAVGQASTWTLHCTKSHHQEESQPLHTTPLLSFPRRMIMVRTSPCLLYVQLLVTLHLHSVTAPATATHLFFICVFLHCHVVSLNRFESFLLSTHLLPIHLMTSVSSNCDILPELTQWQTESVPSTWSSARWDSSGTPLHLHYFKIQPLNTAGLLSAI